MEYFPQSKFSTEAQMMIFNLQDKLVEKEYLSAKLYYDLGTYTGNTSYTADMQVNGNNFLACITTAQNILKEFPYTSMREEVSILLLRAKHKLGSESVLEKKEERMREAIDEYYAFKNEFFEKQRVVDQKNAFAVISCSPRKYKLNKQLFGGRIMKRIKLILLLLTENFLMELLLILMM